MEKRACGKDVEEGLEKGLNLRIDSGHAIEIAFIVTTVECY